MPGDKDLSLKLRAATLFWSSGYYFRIGVRLSDYVPGVSKPLELTDLDVFALKTHQDFLTDVVAADCKSSHKHTSPITRAFWLRGVMDYFSARYGYVVTAKSAEEVHKVAARRLSVTLLTDQELDRLLSQHVDPEVLASELFRETSWEYFEKGLSGLGRDLDGLVRFRNYDFWLNEMGQNATATIGAIRRHKAVLNSDPKGKFHRALSLDLLTLFAMSLLHLASVVYSTSPLDVEAGVRTVLHGGALSLRRKQSIVATVRKLIMELTGDEAVATGLERRLDLDPPYFRDILEVCLRMVNKPGDAVGILRYYQALLFERVLYPTSKAQALSRVGISPVGVKLAKDIALLLEKATGLEPDLLAPVLSFDNYSLTSTGGAKGRQQQFPLPPENNPPEPRHSSIKGAMDIPQLSEEEYLALESEGMNRQDPTEVSPSCEGSSIQTSGSSQNGISVRLEDKTDTSAPGADGKPESPPS